MCIRLCTFVCRRGRTFLLRRAEILIFARAVIVSSGFEHLMEHSESTEDRPLPDNLAHREMSTIQGNLHFFLVCVCVRVFFLSLLFLLFDRALAAPRRASPFPSCAAPFCCCFQVAGRAFDFV